MEGKERNKNIKRKEKYRKGKGKDRKGNQRNRTKYKMGRKIKNREGKQKYKINI